MAAGPSRSIRLLAYGLLLSVGLASGCTGDGALDEVTTGGSSSGSAVGASQPAPRELTVLRTRHQDINHLQVAGRLVTYVVPSPSPSRADRVVVHRLDRRGAKVVYTSAYPKGKIDWAELSNGHLLFADEDRIPSVGDEGTRWKLIDLDLTTGRSRVLARSPGSQRSWPAVPQANSSGVAWSELENPKDPKAGLRVRVWRTDWRRPRDVARHVTGLAAASPHFYRGGAVFSALPGGLKNGLYAMDLYKVNREGVKRRLTRSGLVVDLDVEDGVLTWSERGAEGEAPKQVADPARLLRMALPGGPAEEVAEEPNGGSVVGTADLFAWLDKSGHVRVSTGPAAEARSLPTGEAWLPGRLDGWRDRLVFGTRGSDGLKVHVLQVP